MQTTKIQNVKTSKPTEGAVKGPIARGPLVEVHRAAGATLKFVNGWEVAVRYPGGPLMVADTANAIIDFSHWPTYEVNGADVDAALQSIIGESLPVRRVVVKNGLGVYRLTARRAVLFDTAVTGESDSLGPPPGPPLVRGKDNGAIDVTGGWASFVLCGPNAMDILNKITAVDLREETLPVRACCQGPIFGVNTLFGRFDHGFELHICPDSAEFFWEVLLDAGKEFGLKPAGIEQFKIEN